MFDFIHLFVMRPRMWQQNQRIFLLLSVMVTGSCWVHLKVSPEVPASRGEDAVLNCSFTPPQHPSGEITVRWFAREPNSSPFFSCSVKNDLATQGLGDCSYSEFTHSLTGDPRRGELSLLIRAVQLTDNGPYYCGVELDGQRSVSKKTQLRVTAEPQILSLVVVETDSAPRSLECEVEGNPLPKLVWLSASKFMLDDQGETSQSRPFRLIGKVPYLEEEELTCRAESELGGAQLTYPTHQAPLITVVVCGLMGALLLLLLFIGVIVHCRRNRAPVDSSPVYGNADVVEKHRVRASDPPSNGDSEIQTVYSALGTPPVPQQLSSRAPPEPGILYTAINFQQINR
ncbi:sialic acid binding Ig-like lectin 15, like isoform X2 [Paralichthys olivaceus]|uniref:sialic acid binding Ig-like lectin 15, like isoform X2 n=2 Tax=Paralichthys olivaceus TaxID=8255 RepID=UPI003753E67E